MPMKAMIFAAGENQQMPVPADNSPRALWKVRGRPLIAWHILNLVRAGITDIVINHGRDGQMIEQALGNGARFGATIAYSAEKALLDTAGAVAHARSLLGTESFIAVSAGMYCPHFDFEQAKGVLEDNDVWGNPHPVDQRDVAWLYLVKNPVHHPDGDFALNSFSVANEGGPRYTYSGIAVCRPQMFDAIAPGQSAKLATLLREYAARGQVGGEVYRGSWSHVGNEQQLAQLNAPFTE